MTTNLSVTDQWNETPVGPIVGDPHGPANYCADLGQLTQNEVFLYNRLVRTLLGTFKTFAAGNVNTGTNQITLTAHGIAANTVVRYGNVGGTDMVATGMLAPDVTVYALSITTLYVNVVDANTITLALTSGGAAIDITNAGSGTHYLWIVPASADALMHTSFTTLAGNTIPAGPLRITLAAYFAALNGCTFTGAVVCSGTLTTSSTVTHSGTVTHSNAKVVYSSAGAYTVHRAASLNDAATQTYSGTGADILYVPNVSQNTTYTIDNPPEAGIGPIRYSRRNVGSGFSVAIRRADASLMATLPNTGASWVDLWSHAEDGALMWHVEGHGGDATNLD
jgi:hypothetical protein